MGPARKGHGTFTGYYPFPIFDLRDRPHLV